MPACASVNCTNRQFRGCGKTFHFFPLRHPALVRKWIVNMKRDKWEPSKKSVLCSDHFEESCFDRTGLKTRLRPGIEPTLFNFPTHLQKSTKTRKLLKLCQPPNEPVVDCQNEAEEEPKTPGPTSPLKSSSLSTIHTDHTYCTSESPRSIKRKLDIACDKLTTMKKRLKGTQQKTRRLSKRVNLLETVVKSLFANEHSKLVGLV